MSMDLTGIRNQNEYYTNHYFLSVFEENAADTIKRWQDEAANQGGKTPWAKLNAVASKYFSLRERASRLRSDFALEPIISELASEILTALGYPMHARSSKPIEVEPGVTIPVALEMTKPNGAPWMWAILCRNASDDDDIMQSVRFYTHWHGFADEETGYSPENAAAELTHMSNEELLSKVLFGMDEPPRWVMFIGLQQIALIDRNKWNEKRFLVFQLDEIFGRKETTTLQAMSVLLHRESICPSEGTSLLDMLDENSHKHASGVSKDLKYALRECIEKLGNEVVRDMKERQHVGVFGKDLADTLTIQCLRYMYRILFMLFIEAKPELGYAPMKAETYALGYSFESLREIAENARADSDIERDGYYLKESMDLLFRLIYEGYPAGERSLMDGASVQGVFRIDPLKAHIFDPVRTELIEKARIKNGVLLDIINMMSYAKGQRGKRGGRISYSNLGINQLGSVYEALLSYRGFFAEEDLYEVKRSGDTVDELDVGYFVPERELDQYDEDERVRTGPNPTDPLRMHPKGEFIYRLAGREREKSASYYTPEVLTHCLVKYALKELLEGKTADEILHLTICEPAMGSAAFLNEAVSQLAEAYLARKEKETGSAVAHDQRPQEIQKVKMYIADRNVYGIDLNPVAVELAEVSLWLNTIYQGAYVPWFRTQIVNGNSLIGARRQCYTLAQLQAGKGSAVWYENAPERILPGEKRKFAKQVYHFLAGDPGMCSYTDKVIKAMEPEKIALIKEWNKKFTRAFNDEECDRVLELSAQIDKLWDAHVVLRHEIAEKTTDPLSVWGQPEDKVHTPMTIREKDTIYEGLYLSHGAENASPYARLKAVMDYWCALWFWPIDKAEELPTRREFLFDVQMMLGLDVVRVIGDKKNKGQMSVFDIMPDEDPYVQEMIERYDRFGAVNLDRLRADFPRLRIADEVARQQHFFHWELEFADVFAERGGFDLIVGNPPWIKMEWNEQAVMGDQQPLFAVKKFTANQTAQVRGETLKDHSIYQLYFSEYESTSGIQAFLNAMQNYAELKGQQTNLFKCFLPQAWLFANERGVSAFVHPEGVYDDPRGGALRRMLYARLRKHFMFANELKLFAEVDHHTQFSLNVYGGPLPSVSFDTLANLYEVNTIEQCYDNSITGPVPGIKDENGWCTKGHPDRVIHVGQKELKLFAKLFDGSEEWKMARLPVLHARQLVEVLECFATQKKALGDLGDDVFTTECWHETNAQKDGTIARNVHFPESALDMVYSGPHIGVANPMFKTSRRVCILNSDYDNLDLSLLPENYLQRCNYTPACDLDEYLYRVPVTPWGTKYHEGTKLLARKMLNLSGERTLIGAVVPNQTSHIHGVFGFSFKNEEICILMSGLFASIVFDFYVKITGKSNLQFDVASSLPLLEQNKIIIGYALLLQSISQQYSDIWKRNYKSDYSKLRWTKDDQRLNNERFITLTENWTWDTPLRTDYARRQALVELDVLTAMSLGMTLDQLKTIYRIQFPVLQSYEADTWYDANGRIVFTTNRSLTGVGFDRKTWETEVKGAPAGKKFYRTITDDTQPGGPVERTIEYVAPFDKCDREQDYETAWAFFSKQL